MICRILAACVALCLLPLSGCGQGRGESDVIDSLRAVDGVRKVSTTPWLLRSPDYVFVVDLEDDPEPDTLAEVIRVYGSTVTELPSDDVEIYLRWRDGKRKREIKGWGFRMPEEEYVRAAADWPEDVDIKSGFYPSQGLTLWVGGEDADFPAMLHHVAGLRLQADNVGTGSDRFSINWEDTPPIANFEAAYVSAPTASKISVRQSSPGEDRISVTWVSPAPSPSGSPNPSSAESPAPGGVGQQARPEMEALVDFWATAPTRLNLTLRVGKQMVTNLSNDICPSDRAPRNREFWAYAQRPGHRIVLAPDCGP